MFGASDARLLKRVSECSDLPALADCTSERVREVSERSGIDFATALLYDRVRRSREHGPFIRTIEDLARSEEPLRWPDATVVIVPGAFHRTFPRSGADGRIVRGHVERLGCRIETVPLPDFGTLAGNAERIAEWLKTHDREPVILVSISKGGSDIKCALSRPDAELAFRNVTFWFNLSGILDGAPFVTWLFGDSLRSRWSRFLLRRYCPDLRLLRELRHRSDSPLAHPFRLAGGMQAIHVVGFPRVRHAANGLSRRNHARVRPNGPNDGAGILLADAVRWPGNLYPVWGADHYLRPRGYDIGRIIGALFRYAAMETASGVRV